MAVGLGWKDKGARAINSIWNSGLCYLAHASHLCINNRVVNALNLCISEDCRME